MKICSYRVGAYSRRGAFSRGGGFFKVAGGNSRIYGTSIFLKYTVTNSSLKACIRGVTKKKEGWLEPSQPSLAGEIPLRKPLYG